MSAAHRLAILGTRGIPALHGGFETFAERLALHLAGRGWQVTVACQAGPGERREAEWQGVRLVHYPARFAGPLGTLEFDARSVFGSLGRGGLVLTLGYNTAVLGLAFRARGIRHLMNMDGIEWRRSKWSAPMRAWFYLNERAARFAADHLVADHPAIAEHLARHVPRGRISMIPYGADAIVAADPAPLAALGLARDSYLLVVARAEPENSLLEIVAAYSRVPRAVPLVVVGGLAPDRNRYHRRVMAAAAGTVRFPGAIYDRAVLDSLRYHARLYLHGHRVGGTNPSLVEALGAGNAVLAHDNVFNRWVAGPEMRYFADEDGCAAALDAMLVPGFDLSAQRAAARRRHGEAFTWPAVLAGYEALLERWA